MTTIVELPSLPTIDENRLARDVEAWLAFETATATATGHDIVWCPHWATEIVVNNVDSLRTLISALSAGEFAGLKRRGSSGPWAQVRAFEDRGDLVGGWPFELHKHRWTLGVPDGVWKLIGDQSSDVAAHLWNWVAACAAPAEQPQPTTRPRAGQGYW